MTMMAPNLALVILVCASLVVTSPANKARLERRETRLNNQCNRVSLLVEECWLKYYLPMCKGKNPVIECAESKLGVDFHSCTEAETLRKAVHIQNSIYCTNLHFKEEFQSKIPCWISTRRCTTEVASAADDASQTECGHLIHKALTCDHYQACFDLHSNFTAALTRATSCGRFNTTTDVLVKEYLKTLDVVEKTESSHAHHQSSEAETGSMQQQANQQPVQTCSNGTTSSVVFESAALVVMVSLFLFTYALSLC